MESGKAKDTAGAPASVRGVRHSGLHISRHVGEMIYLGPDIRIRVVGITSGVVRLAIVAPRHIQIDRERQ